MAAPTISASLNKATYAPGEEVILTIAYDDADRAVLRVRIELTDSQGNQAAPIVATGVIDQGELALTDESTRTHAWELVSDTGTLAVYRTVA